MLKRSSMVVAVAFSLGFLGCASVTTGARWFSYTSSEYGELLADKSSVVRADDSAKVWVVHGPMKLQPQQPVYTKELYSIDCREHEYHLLQVIGVDRNGQTTDIPVGSTVRNIAPDSMEAAIEAFACKPLDSWWIPVSHVPETLEERVQSARKGFFD